MGVYEIAKAAGVSPQAVSNWVARNPDFPKPLASLASGPVWDGSTIRAWMKRTDEKGGQQVDAFEKGKSYPMAEIQRAFGGDNMSYLPQVGNRIVCGRFTAEMNPRAPYEVLVGDPPRVQRAAELLATQGGSLPVFVKEGPNQWRYQGQLRFVEYVTDGRLVQPKAKAAGRTDVVVGMLRFEDAA